MSESQERTWVTCGVSLTCDNKGEPCENPETGLYFWL